MKTDTEEIEIDLLVEAIRLKYGYDFSRYARASLTRRIKKGLAESGLKRISDMIPLILHDRAFFNACLANLSVHTTEMFRDSQFFRTVREIVVPYLKTYTFIKVWVAGVSTGEEVYSLAILLKEEDLYDKTLIYATDFNDVILEQSKKGIYSEEKIKQQTRNYQKAGGKKSFDAYYHSEYGSVIFDRTLKENIVFANHNLVTDESFGEMTLIFCRNVMIYFNKELQNRVLQLFSNSLCKNGFLCLGTKETIDFSDIADAFVPVMQGQKIYQKKTKTG